jgi:hypothetical protein
MRVGFFPREESSFFPIGLPDIASQPNLSMAAPRSITENGSLYLAQQAARKSERPLRSRSYPVKATPSPSRIAKFFRALVRTKQPDPPRSLFAFTPLGRLGSVRGFSEAEKIDRDGRR